MPREETEATPLLPNKPKSVFIYTNNSQDSGLRETIVKDIQESYNIIMEIKAWLREVSVPVYILVILFGIASWIDINGVFVELPLLVNELPEGWSLPSYITIIIQVANIAPLSYFILNHFYPRKVKEWPVIYIIITIGVVSCVLLANFWKETTIIGGQERSTALLALAACLALVDTTSSVAFLPYMAMYKSQYLVAYYIGEGLSGMIPGLVGLIQGLGGDPECVNSSSIITNETTGINYTEYNVWPVYPPPRFTVDVFFYIMGAMVLVSGISFSIIHWTNLGRSQRLETTVDITQGDKETRYIPDPCSTVSVIAVHYGTSNADLTQNDELTKENHLQKDGVTNPSFTDNTPYSEIKHTNNDNVTVSTKDPNSYQNGNISHSGSTSKTYIDTSDSQPSRSELPFTRFVLLLIAIGWSNGITNGVLPSLQSYACLPYGNLAYNLTVRLSTLANPLACFIAMFLNRSSHIEIGVLTVLGTICAGYQIALAALSPYPPLQGQVSGDILVIASGVLLTGFLSYVKMQIAAIFSATGGRKQLLWVGGITQVGSFCGAIITFVLVNVLGLFKQADVCDL